MHSPARSAALRRLPRQQTNSPGLVIVLVIFVSVVLGMVYFGSGLKKHSTGANQPAASVQGKPVHLVFEPPYIHNDLQNANQQMVVDIIQDPNSWGLKDKPPIDLSGDPLQIYLSTLETDNHFYHFNSGGDIQLSYTGCCVGIGQVLAETSACSGWELADIRRNAWCSAKIFADYYELYRYSAPDRAYELTVARYKGAVLLDGEGFMVVDENGLPTIPGDPADPESPRSQVNRVFIDPDSGKAMFRFEYE